MVQLNYSRITPPSRRGYSRRSYPNAPATNNKIVNIGGSLYVGGRGGLTRIAGDGGTAGTAAESGGSGELLSWRGRGRGVRGRGRGWVRGGWRGRGRGRGGYGVWRGAVVKRRGGRSKNMTLDNSGTNVDSGVRGKVVGMTLKKDKKRKSKNKTLVNGKVNKRSRNRSIKLDPRSLVSCVFYNRFGHCKRRECPEGCPYIHDPERLNVCMKWLRGVCPLGTSCLLLHEHNREKMPICNQYLMGSCTRDDCPYLHVRKGDDVKVCKDFAFRGFCEMGGKCPMLHSWDCQEYKRKGECSLGAKCRLRHRDKQNNEDEADVAPPEEEEIEALLDSEGAVFDILNPLFLCALNDTQ